jgi:hypothetical protein
VVTNVRATIEVIWKECGNYQLLMATLLPEIICYYLMGLRKTTQNLKIVTLCPVILTGDFIFCLLM